MDRFYENSAILLGNGAVVRAGLYKGGGSVELSNLDRQTALYLATCLINELDRMYQDFKPLYALMYELQDSNFINTQIRAQQQEDYYKGLTIFGEDRPANRNLAIKVQHDRGEDKYRVYADIRNKFSDRPELRGGRFLQAGFIAVMDTVDLSDPSTWQ